jgi:hypothetical protein
MTKSVEIRAHIVDVFRRDLIGPGERDADLANERLNESPSRWYLTGFLAPAEDALGLNGADDESDPAAQEEMETGVEKPDAEEAGAAADNEEPEAPNTRRRFLPSSIGLTVLLDPDVKEIEARISWGDYRTEPPLPEAVFLPTSWLYCWRMSSQSIGLVVPPAVPVRSAGGRAIWPSRVYSRPGLPDLIAPGA